MAIPGDKRRMATVGALSCAERGRSLVPQGNNFLHCPLPLPQCCGPDKDSEKRQRAAIEAYAKANGIAIVAWHYDKAVRGSDPVTARPGFADMLAAIAANGVRTIIVESPDRFARDLAVQLAGHDHLRRLDETRRVAINIAKLPELVKRPQY